MADQNLNIGIKVTSDTAGAKQATAAIDGVEKSVEELAKTEKEAINTNGMYLDSLGRIHDESGKFVKVSAEERAGLKERIKIQQQDTVTTTGAVAAKKELGKSSSNSAMGILALSNAFQDAQYGMAGMINNIPLIVTGMGLGMGVAGAVQAAAVGVQILTKNFDIFGVKAEEAREKAGELAAEMMGAADKAYKEAASVEALAAARENQAAAMAKVDEAYKTTIALSDKAMKQAQEERDAQVSLIDAQAGMEMARIQLAEATGQMTKEEAIFAKDKARVEAESRKQTAQTLAEETKAAELRKKAAAEVETAEKKRQAAAGLAEGGVGLMNEAERKAARENIESMKAMQGVSQGRQEQLARAIDDKSLIDFDPEMTEKNRQANRKKLAQERDDYLATQAAIDKENAKLAADEAAKRRTGIASRDELNKTVEAENKAAEQGVGRAGEFREQAAGTESGIKRSNQLFNLRQAAGSMGALAQVEAERTKQREEAEKERERAAKEAEREEKRRSSNLKQVGSAGGSLASTLAGDGLAPGFADSLREAAGGAGSDAGLNRLIAMVAKLTANSSKLSEQAKSKLDKLEAEIEDLRTAK